MPELGPDAQAPGQMRGQTSPQAAQNTPELCSHFKGIAGHGAERAARLTPSKKCTSPDRALAPVTSGGKDQGHGGPGNARSEQQVMHKSHSKWAPGLREPLCFPRVSREDLQICVPIVQRNPRLQAPPTDAASAYTLQPLPKSLEPCTTSGAVTKADRPEEYETGLGAATPKRGARSPSPHRRPGCAGQWMQARTGTGSAPL